MNLPASLSVCSNFCYFTAGLQSRRIFNYSGSDSNSDLKISTQTPILTPLQLRPNKRYPTLKENYHFTIFPFPLMTSLHVQQQYRPIREHVDGGSSQLCPNDGSFSRVGKTDWILLTQQSHDLTVTPDIYQTELYREMTFQSYIGAASLIFPCYTMSS